MASYIVYTYILSDLLNHKINADFEHAHTLVYLPNIQANYSMVVVLLPYSMHLETTCGLRKYAGSPVAAMQP